MKWVILLTNLHGTFPLVVKENNAILRNSDEVLQWFVVNKLSEFKGTVKIEVMEVYSQCDILA